MGKAGAEGVQHVDCARDAVEADAFQADFAHQGGGGDGAGGVVRGGDGVKGQE